MELFLLPYVKVSLFIEVLSLFATVRYFWAQTLSSELSDCKSSSMLMYIIRKRRLENDSLISNITAYSASQTTDLDSLLEYEKQKSNLIFQYNVLNSGNRWLTWLVLGTVVCITLYMNPLILGSLFISDLLTTRIHQHILRSM